MNYDLFYGTFFIFEKENVRCTMYVFVNVPHILLPYTINCVIYIILLSALFYVCGKYVTQDQYFMYIEGVWD